MDQIFALVAPRAMSCNVLGVGQYTDIPAAVVSHRAQRSCCSLLPKLWLSLIIFTEHLYSLIYILSISLPYIYYQSLDYPGNTKVGCAAFWRKQCLQLQIVHSNHRIFHLPFKLKKTILLPEALSLDVFSQD